MTATLTPPRVTTTLEPVDTKDTRVALWVVVAFFAAALIAVAGLAIGRWYGYTRGEDAGRTVALEECAKGVDGNRAVQAVVENALRVPRGSHVAICVVKD